MAIAEEATGTWTSSGTTEADLAAASAVDGVFQLFVDVNDMVAADVLEIRAYEMVIGGGTTRQLMCWTLSNVQTDKVWVSPALVFMNGWKFTLKAVAGGIVAPWSIRKLT